MSEDVESKGTIVGRRYRSTEHGCREEKDNVGSIS